MKKFTWVALAAALFLGVIVSPFASSWLDGLERVADDEGFLKKGEGEPMVESPARDYVFPGITGGRLATALAGGLGTALTFAVAFAIAAALRKRGK